MSGEKETTGAEEVLTKAVRGSRLRGAGARAGAVGGYMLAGTEHSATEEGLSQEDAGCSG